MVAQDPYRYFRVEARELIELIGRGLLDLEAGQEDASCIARMLRAAHTLKGAARVVKQPQIADLAHALEGTLEPHRGEVHVPPRSVDAAQRCVDAILGHVVALSQGGEAPAAPRDPDAPAASIEELLPVLGAQVSEIDDLLDGIAESHVQVARIRESLDAVDRMRRVADAVAEQLRASRPRAADGMSQRVFPLADELAVLTASVARELGPAVEQADRELRQIRETAERLRLLPASRMFIALERTLREAGRTVGRRVAFQARGGHVRLEADLLGGIQAALVQAVRNAVAHGIEAEDDRIAAGKSAVAVVELDIVRHGSLVTFTCRDDGRGIDLEAVRRVAARRGLLPTDGRPLTSEALIELLSRGGISTSATVTEDAGRGVGLDVIRDTVRRLGGDLAIATEPRRGTSVAITVPVRLTAIDALVVEVGHEVVAIPLDAVRRGLRVEASALVPTPAGEAVLLDGQALPYAHLRGVLAPDAPGTPTRGTIVVVEDGAGLVAVGVDRVVGVEGILTRPLPSDMVADPIVVGAMLDASGVPRLVLDPVALAVRVRAHDVRPASAPAPRLPVLVIDDSLTTRMLEQSILEAAGYEVDLASSAEEGMEMARRRSYALFLVDVEMPGMDGFTFVARTRADAELRVVPAILVTSRNAPEDRARGLAAGASAYVVKSEFDQKDLLQRIRALVA